jgi:hypothetical protein
MMEATDENASQQGISARQAERAELIAAIALTCVLLAVHVVRLLYAGPLWRDEISTVNLATQPTLRALWDSLFLDPFPALFYVVLRGWHALVGDSDSALRLLGFLIGISVIGAFWVTSRLTGRRSPILTLVLLGFCPTLVIWGDTLRSYGLGIFWIVLSFGLLWRVVVRPGWREIILATATSTCSVQTAYTNALLIFACGMAACVVAVHRRRWKTAGKVLCIGGIAALSLVPYIPLLGKGSSWIGILRVNFPLTKSFKMLAAALLGPGHFLFWLWLTLLAVAAGLTAFFWFRPSAENQTSPDSRELALYSLICACLAFAATMTFFRVVGWGTNIWYYLPMLAIMALSLDSLCDFPASFRFLLLARTGTAVISALLIFPVLFESVQARATNMDLVARILTARATPGDLVIVNPYVDGITFRRHFHREVEWVTLPKLLDLPIPPERVLEDFRRPDAVGPILEKIDLALKNGHRVWIASSWPLRTPAQPPPPVLPLQQSDPRTSGHFLWRWSETFQYHLHSRAKDAYMVTVPATQPINIYEHSFLFVFSGWRERKETQK